MDDLFGSDSENEKAESEPSSAPSDSDAASKSEQSSSDDDENEETEETIQKRPAKRQIHEDLFGSDSDEEAKPEYASEPEEHEKSASVDEGAGGSSPAASAASSSRVEQLGATQEDLFGEDVDDVSSSSDDVKRRVSRQEMEQEDDDADREEPAEEAPETMINAEIPKISTNLGREMHFVRLPNFLSVEPRPFHPDLYEDEIDEDEVLDEEGKARLKLKVENTIRWRRIQNEFGDSIKESNARIVRWSDGSLSLHLGNEIFDVYKTPVQGDCNHLFIRQGTGLQGQAVFKTKLSFRPHSTDSLTHRKMTLSLADKSNKTQKIRILAELGKDPESHRQEMIKKEEERLRAQQRRESMQRRIREKSGTRSLTASMLEQDESDEDTSLNAIKKQVHDRFKSGRKGASQSIYTDSESELEDRLNKAKGTFDSDEEAGKTKKRRAMVVEESDDDDDDEL